MSTHNKRRLVLVSGWLLLLFPTINNTFSVLLPHLLANRPWDLDELTLAYSIYLLFFSLAGFIAWPLVEHWGLRRSLFLSGLVYGGGWMVSGWSPSLPIFYLAFGLAVSLPAGLLYYVVLMNTLRLYPENAGRISGILLSASGISPFLMAPVFAYAYEAYGVQTSLLVFGLAASILISSLSFFQPQQLSSLEDSGGQGLGPRQVLALPRFYLLFFIFMTIALAGNMIISVLGFIAEEQLGLGPRLAALAVSTYTLANFIGRLTFGGISDGLGELRALGLSFFLMILALLSLAWTGQSQALIFFGLTLILGFAFSGPVVIFPSLTSQAFGQAQASSNYALLFLAYSLGAFLGPRLAAEIYGAKGNFFLAYLIASGLVGLGLLSISGYERLIRRMDNEN